VDHRLTHQVYHEMSLWEPSLRSVRHTMLSIRVKAERETVSQYLGKARQSKKG